MKRTIKTKIALLAGALTSVSGVNAATLVNWDFSGITGAQGTNAQAAAGNTILASTVSNTAAGLSSTNLVAGGILEYATGNATSGEANLQRWDGNGSTIQADGVNDGWIQFTLSSTTPNTLTLSSISISEWRNGAGAPPNIGFQVNVDGAGFVNYAAYQNDPDSGSVSFDTFSFNNTIPVANNVIVRFAPVGGPMNTPRGDGNLHINGLTVNGTVIPEPTSALLGGFGALGLLLRRRRA